MSEEHGKHGDDEPQPFTLGKNRIEALSDGIFAVAMTLLILDFQLPKLPSNAPNVLVVPALAHLWPSFISYVVSFLSLGVFWVGHHNMYHGIRRADRALLWLNILFFMFVACLPFSTSVLNAFPQTEIAPLMFGGTLTVIGWLLYLQFTYACTQPGMFADFVTPTFQSAVRIRFLAYPIVATLTMLICFWSIPISLTIYLILLPLYMIPAKIEHQRTLADILHVKLTSNWRKGLIAGGIVAAVIIGWAAFRPELLFINTRSNDIFPAAFGKPVVVAAGQFHGVAHTTDGNVVLYKFPNGGLILRLTHFRTSNGPDTHVLLIAASDATDNATVAKAYIEVAKLKANEGDQNYNIPPGLNLNKYHAVTVWCKRFNVNCGTAPLK